MPPFRPIASPQRPRLRRSPLPRCCAGEADRHARRRPCRSGDAGRRLRRLLRRACRSRRCARPGGDPAPRRRARREAPPAAPLTLDQRSPRKIHELFGTKAERILDRKYKAAVEAFYAGALLRAGVDRGRHREQARQGGYRLSRRASMPTASIRPITPFRPSPATIGGAGRSRAQVHGRGADCMPAMPQTGRIHYSRVSPDILYNLVTPEPAEVLGKMAEAKNVGAGARRLQSAPCGLQGPQGEARGSARRRAAAAPAAISIGQALKVGMDDPRVPDAARPLRPARGADTTFDKALADAVKDYQQQRKHEADRRVRQRDRRCAQRPAQRARGRHHHRQHGALALDAARPRQSLCDGQHPGIHAAGVRPGSLAWQTRVVVGQPARRRRRCSPRR